MLSYFKMVFRHSKPFSTCGITGKWRFSHISLPKNDGNIHLGNHFLKVITKKNWGNLAVWKAGKPPHTRFLSENAAKVW